MASYLVAEDLWDVVDDNNATSPTDEPENVDELKK